METAWIQVFILTLTQCIAPEGKMVCQEEVVEYQFADQVECEVALYQMFDVAARVDDVIVNREGSYCRAAAKEIRIYASANDAVPQSEGGDDVEMLPIKEPRLDFTQTAHIERLQSIPNCTDVANVPPCKIGEIIIESDTEPENIEIWRRQN